MNLGTYIAVTKLKCIITWENRLAIHLPPLQNNFWMCGLVQNTLCSFISSSKIEANTIVGLYIFGNLIRRIFYPD